MKAWSDGDAAKCSYLFAVRHETGSERNEWKHLSAAAAAVANALLCVCECDCIPEFVFDHKKTKATTWFQVPLGPEEPGEGFRKGPQFFCCRVTVSATVLKQNIRENAQNGCKAIHVFTFLVSFSN